MFINLTTEDCQYLLNLISEMDGETVYTERQRAYTVPKLHQIMKDPKSRRLAFQDVEYLLELIEDDGEESLMQYREMARENLEKIRELQDARFAERRNIEAQREARRLKRVVSVNLEEAAEILTRHTTA